MRRLPLTRYIPEGARQIEAAGTDAAVFAYETNDVPYAVAYHGKANKSDWHHRFKTPEQREKHIADYIAGRRSGAELKAKMRADRNQPHTLKMDDILYSSWGYDQTNIDFYQVTRVVGPATVEIREIASADVKATEPLAMQNSCVAVPNAFKGEPMLKRASAHNSVRIASYAHASPWDGRPKHYSWDH